MVLSSLPFQSTSHAASSRPVSSSGTLYCFAFDGLAFCWPIHSPPGASVIIASAFGYMPGDLNSGVVFAIFFGTPRPPPAGPGAEGARGASCAFNATAADASPSAIPVLRNSRRFMVMMAAYITLRELPDRGGALDGPGQDRIPKIVDRCQAAGRGTAPHEAGRRRRPVKQRHMPRVRGAATLIMNEAIL